MKDLYAQVRSPQELRLARRRFLQGMGAAALAAGLPARTWSGEAPRRGGTLTMIVFPEPNMLVGAFNTSPALTMVPPKMHDGLCTYDFNYNLHPLLATGWRVSADGTAIEFSLRQGVKWHDGKDFTSADVAYSVMEIWRKLHPRGRTVYANVKSVETPDAHTAILRLAVPSPAIMSALASYESPVLPRHIYEGTDPLTNPNNNAPVGTGPFKFVEWSKGSHIVVERNPDYWDRNKPYLDRIVFRFDGDAGARAAALEAGEAQMAVTNPVPFSDVKRFRDNPKFQVETRGEELNNNIYILECNLRNPILQKLPVRQAIMHAVNREALARNVWYGEVKPADSPVPHQLTRFHTDEVKKYPYDPKTANQLLDQAGHPRPSGGMRFKLRLDWIPLGESYQLAAEFLRQSLRRVGIDIEIRSVDLPTYVHRIYTDYDFDMTAWNLTVTADPTIGLQRIYYSKAIKKGAPFVNASGYSSPDMDQVLEAAATEFDSAKRAKLFAKFQQIAMTDLPVLPLEDLVNLTIASRKVHDFVIRPEGARDTFADVWMEA